MSQLGKTTIILGILLAIIFSLSIISNILMPFTVGIIIAYFLDPAADKLENKGFSRTVATLIILTLFIFIISLFIAIIGPILYQQTLSLLSQLPTYINSFNSFITPYIENLYKEFGYEEGYKSSSILQEISEYMIIFSKNIALNLWQSSIAFINLFSLVFITPVVSFYLLKDWDLMISNINKLLPLKYKKEIRGQFRMIDRTLSSYIRGQTNVCLILGIFYAISLSLAGLNYGFLIGFLTGIFSFIPYFGVFIGMATGVTIAMFQFETYPPVILISSIFLIGQFIEGNFITPKLVGNKIGIHPVLIIFSLLTGGTLFGFIGILFAIPAIAILGVLTRFFIKKYKRSNLFLNQNKSSKL